MLATLADVTCALALSQTYDVFTEMPVTTDMHVRYYRQPRSGPLKAEGRLVHGGRRLRSVECAVLDADDRTLIRATATYMMVPQAAPIMLEASEGSGRRGAAPGDGEHGDTPAVSGGDE
jgi:acyl-coenzyme A thioesterase PaaI-like protein